MPLFLLTFYQAGECSGCQWGIIQLAQDTIQSACVSNEALLCCEMLGIIASINISVVFLINSGDFELSLNRLNELEALAHPTEIKAFVGMCLLLSI